MESKIRWVQGGVLAILVLGAAWKLFLPHGEAAQVRQSTASREIVVYVTGAVTNPGLVRLPLDARLDDALKKAVPQVNANLEVLNPAEKLRDGQKINVPAKQPPAGDGATGASPGSGVPAGSTTSSPTPVVSGSSASVKGKININTAGVAELDQLPGVGPVLAQRIIDYRTEHGPFAAPEELQNVSGIGAKTYEKMAAAVTVGP